MAFGSSPLADTLIQRHIASDAAGADPLGAAHQARLAPPTIKLNRPMPPIMKITGAPKVPMLGVPRVK